MDPSADSSVGHELDEDVEDLFQAAADHLASLVTADSSSVPDAVKLKLYGLYKQATVGPCSASKPVFWDRAGVSKWNAWKEVGGLDQQAAMQQYITVIKRQDPQWAAAAEGSRGIPGSGNKAAAAPGKKSGVGGPVFSTLIHSADQQQQQSPDACNGKQGRGSSSIHELAGQGDLAALQACLSSGTAVDSRDETGCTALHFAADRGQQGSVMLLLAAGADINAQDDDGQTPLHYAALCEQLQVCELLLRQGADENRLDADGKSSQQVAPDKWTCWGS